MSAPDNFKEQREAAAKFFGETGTVKGETGNRSVSKSDYHKFVQTNFGLEKAVIDKAAEADRAVIAGAIDTAAAALKERIVAAKEAGEDVNDIRVSTTIARPDGAVHATVLASRTSNNPQTNSKTTTYGAVQLRIRAKSQMDKGQLADIRDTIEKAVLKK